MRPTVILLLLFLSTGCAHRLPNIKAEAIQQTMSFPGVTSTVDASGINITDATIRAAEVSWRISAFGFTSVTTAKGFQQKRARDEGDK